MNARGPHLEVCDDPHRDLWPAPPLSPAGPFRQGGELPYEVEMFRLHEACRAGDRAACVHFGVIIGEHRERRAELERLHPEIFWWNH